MQSHKNNTSNFGFDSYAAKSFLQHCESIQTDFHQEYSVKLSPGYICDKRILLGTERRHLTPDQWLRFFLSLGLPEDACQRLMPQINNANAVLFAVEEAEHTQLKVYLEFWEQLIGRIQHGHKAGQPFPLNQGIKWCPLQPFQWLEDSYVCYPMLKDDEILTRLHALIPTSSGLPIHNALQPIFKTFNRKPKPDLVYLEVADSHNLRRSFDLNCYSREMTVSDISSQLVMLGKQWAINPTKFSTVLKQCQTHPLGHLSGGYDRNGQPFFTFYYEA